MSSSPQRTTTLHGDQITVGDRLVIADDPFTTVEIVSLDKTWQPEGAQDAWVARDHLGQFHAIVETTAYRAIKGPGQSWYHHELIYGGAPDPTCGACAGKGETRTGHLCGCFTWCHDCEDWCRDIDLTDIETFADPRHPSVLHLVGA